MPEQQLAVASNVGFAPVTIDSEGRQLGGGDYVVVDTADEVTAAAIAAGNIGLVTYDDTDGSWGELDPAAQAAFDTLKARQGADPGEEPQVPDPAGGSGEPATTAGTPEVPDPAAGSGSTAAASDAGTQTPPDTAGASKARRAGQK